MHVHGTHRPDPRGRGYPQGHADAGEPLRHHQAGKHPVRTFPGAQAFALEEVFRQLREMPQLLFTVGEVGAEGSADLCQRDHG